MSGIKEIHRLRSQIDVRFKKAMSIGDLELQSDFAKYLCVLAAGFLENSVYEILVNFSKLKGSPHLSRFVESKLATWTSPNSEKLCALLGSFDTEWRRRLDLYLKDEKKEAINSLVALRHKIAHGESVGTSLRQVHDYYVIVSKVVDELFLIVV